MADIFISYAREDAAKVERLIPLLSAAGYSVWWDSNLTSGARYLKETEAELKSAKAVLVIWSQVSLDSHWVADEAAVGRDENRLAAISFDGSMPPLGFRQFQVTDFSNWKGKAQEPPFTNLIGALERLIGSSGAMPPPAATPVRNFISRRTSIIGGLSAAGVAVIAAAAMFAMNQTSGAPTTQRIAFFGFTSANDDPAAKRIAEAATDRMFQELGRNKLDTAARTETLGTAPDQRFLRATDLGAIYALSGEARSGTNGITLSVRLEEVPSRTTLWDKSFSAPAPGAADLLPAQAALPTNDTARCIVAFRSKLTRDTVPLLKLVADRCREGIYLDSSEASLVSVRALAKADPNSARFQADLSWTLSAGVDDASQSLQQMRISEAEAALKRATELDANEPWLNLARFNLARVNLLDGAISLADYEKLLGDELKKLEGVEPLAFSQANLAYVALLFDLGRWRDAQAYARAAHDNDPGLPPSGDIGYLAAMTGELSKAQAEFEQDFARYPTEEVWLLWTSVGVFLGAGDVESMLKSPPDFVPKPTVDCWREISEALSARTQGARALAAKRISACEADGNLDPDAALIALASLEDLDAAFKLVDEGRTTASALFWPTLQTMRADRRFLPMVEKFGLMDYWKASGHGPDFCATADVPVCIDLKGPPNR